MIRFLAGLWLAALVAVSPAAAQSAAIGGAPSSPSAYVGRIADEAGIIDAAGEQAIGAQLAALEERTSDQVAVITLTSLQGNTVEQASLKIANQLALGSANLNNGVLLLVAPNERKVRIEVGRGLEGLLTDAQAARIVQLMLAKFREGKMTEGVSVAVDAIDRLLSSDGRRPYPNVGAAK
jgi:uncharacterized protein